MFDGIKLLCGGSPDKEEFWILCRHSTIAPESKYLKIANLDFRCPSCGHTSQATKDYFGSLIKLKQAAQSLKKQGAYIYSYSVVCQGCDRDDIDLTAYLLENNDWTDWNLQLASFMIKCEAPSHCKTTIWNDAAYLARPLVYPNQEAITFSDILTDKDNSIFKDRSISNATKDLIGIVVEYNSSWQRLLNENIFAAPVDLTNELLTFIAGVESLEQLFTDSDQYS